MKCASALHSGKKLEQVVDRCSEEILQQLGTTPDLVVVFTSGEISDEFAQHADSLFERLGSPLLLGCTADSLIGTRQELERENAISIWAASWPGVELIPFHLEIVRSPDGISISGWPNDEMGETRETDACLLFADPFSFATDVLLDRMAEDRSALTIVGGMASRGYSPGNNQLILNRDRHTQGAVGVVIRGLQLTPVLSQGCRPIGEPMVVTRAERNEVFALGGQPALDRLKEVFDQLSADEQRLVQEGLLVGRVIDERRESFQMGDFLVRGVVGIDEDRRSIAVGDYFRVGQTIQFHVRDEQSADSEFRQLLERVDMDPSPVGGLLFSCNGRGSQLFSDSHHDAECIYSRFGELPIAGFFAAGEIGPVGGRSFTHGFSASVALFAPLTNGCAGGQQSSSSEG